jgi:hypothetical protein
MSGKAERPHYSSLITHHLEFILVIVIVVIFFFDDVQFNWIQSDDLELDSTLFAIHGFAFVHISIDMNFGFTFRACSGRHLITSSYQRR